MKQILFTTAAFLLFATATVKAQPSYVAYAAKSSHIKAVPPKTEAMSLLERKNVKAYDHFTTKYGTAVDANIIIESNSTMVVFTNEGILTRVYYKPNGQCTGTIRYYDASKLPANIAGIIKSEFSGYCIFGITEITKDDKTAYMVKIENDKTWKTVQVVDGEISVAEQFKKGN